MSSGGHTEGDSGQHDLDRLLDSALALAKQRLAEASDFEPFAIVSDASSRVLAVDWDTSPLGIHPEPEQLVLAAIKALRNFRDQARCTALVVNTHLSKEKTDALEVRLEHEFGRSIVVFLPYKRAKFGNRVEYGELKAYSAKPNVWVA